MQIRPASLKDLPTIEALYRGQAQDGDWPTPFAPGTAPKRQFASTRLWSLLNNTFAAILPIASAADHVYVGEASASTGIVGFVQAQTAPAGKHVWQILNLCLRPDLDRFQAGTALLDHLCNEGLSRGVGKFIIRLAVGDPEQLQLPVRLRVLEQLLVLLERLPVLGVYWFSVNWKFAFGALA